jgi:hypothetical protein
VLAGLRRRLAESQRAATLAGEAADLLARERDRLADDEDALASSRASLPAGSLSWPGALDAAVGDAAQQARLEAWASRLRADSVGVRHDADRATAAAEQAASSASEVLDDASAGTRAARRAAAERLRPAQVAAGVLPAEDGSLRSRVGGFADGLADDVTGTVGLLAGLVGLAGDPRPRWAELGRGVTAAVRDPAAALRAAVDWTDVEQGDWGHWAGTVAPGGVLAVSTAGAATAARTSRVLDALQAQEALAARIRALRDAAEAQELALLHDEWGALHSPLAPGGGLAAHELGGGHVIARHVGLVERELRARLARWPHLHSASAFPDRHTAELFVAEALDTSSAQVVAWLGQPVTKELAVVVDLHRVTGVLLRPGWPTVRAVTGVKVVLVRAPTPLGFRIRTAFPWPTTRRGMQ